MMVSVDLRDRIRLDELDKGIRHEVEVLAQFGVETDESCEGGVGHAYTEPTVAFRGDRAEGYRAFGIALWQGLRVFNLRRVWSVQDGELVGPHWEMTFWTDRFDEKGHLRDPKNEKDRWTMTTSPLAGRLRAFVEERLSFFEPEAELILEAAQVIEAMDDEIVRLRHKNDQSRERDDG